VNDSSATRKPASCFTAVSHVLGVVATSASGPSEFSVSSSEQAKPFLRRVTAGHPLNDFLSVQERNMYESSVNSLIACGVRPDQLRHT
jgi:hypothetical protein